MKLHSVLKSTRRWTLVPLVVGATVFQLGGCDPQVRTAILTGLQTSLTGLVTALINAFFLALQNASTSQPGSTVEAVFESLRQYVA